LDVWAIHYGQGSDGIAAINEIKSQLGGQYLKAANGQALKSMFKAIGGYTSYNDVALRVLDTTYSTINYASLIPLGIAIVAFALYARLSIQQRADSLAMPGSDEALRVRGPYELSALKMMGMPVPDVADGGSAGNGVRRQRSRSVSIAPTLDDEDMLAVPSSTVGSEVDSRGTGTPSKPISRGRSNSATKRTTGRAPSRSRSPARGKALAKWIIISFSIFFC
jgi:hypothetical protein